MTKNKLQSTHWEHILSGIAKSGPFRIQVAVITGEKNTGSKFPDIEVSVYFLGLRVLHHKFVL